MAIYLISDDGYSIAEGPNARRMADKLIQMAGFRECNREEYVEHRKAIDTQDNAS